MAPHSGTAAATGQVRVWDPLLRLFHWSLALVIAVAFLAEDSAWLHETAGYGAAGLVLFRLGWGVIGPRHARFADFVTSPAQVKAYLLSLLSGHPRRYLGHNPAGGWMILALLALIGLTAGTGILSTRDAFWGNKLLEDVHEATANLTLVCIFIHLAGVAVSSLAHRENLVRAMITGAKKP